LLPRQPQRHQQRADRRRGAQQAEAPRAGMQDVLGEDRQQRGGAAEQHREQIQRDHAEARPCDADEMHAGEQGLQRGRLAFGRRLFVTQPRSSA
jgi:hypothetical protein